MPENIRYQDDELFNPETAREHSDVPLRPLWWAVVIFVIFAAISHVVVWSLYKAFVMSERDRSEAPLTAVTRPADADVPKNQPLLQPFPKSDVAGKPMPPNRTTPVVDMADMRASEEKVLGSYGWVDRSKGVARVPIDVAKQRAVQVLQSMPAQAPAVPAAPSQILFAPSPAPEAPVTQTGGAH